MYGGYPDSLTMATFYFRLVSRAHERSARIDLGTGMGMGMGMGMGLLARRLVNRFVLA